MIKMDLKIKKNIKTFKFILKIIIKSYQMFNLFF